jgi:methyl coenzyme M reductase alpha subunit
MRALDGYIKTITLDDNCTDEIEKELFHYLEKKQLEV